MLDTLSKTLVIRFSSVGDIVLSSPLVRALRHQFPQMQMDFLVKEAYADLVRYSPHLSNIMTFPNTGGIRDLLRLRRVIQDQHYTSILDIHGSLRSRVLTCGVRGVRRVHKRVIARTLLVRFKRDLYSKFGGAPGIAERYLEIVAQEGIRTDEGGTNLELFVPPGIREKAETLLATSGIATDEHAIGICPSARHFTKIWPEDRFAAVAIALATRWNHPVLLFGSDEDSARCGKIKARIAAEAPLVHVVDFSGSCSLLESAALMDHCRVVITNDSGLMHIASARQRPVVSIFGSTVRQFGFFPQGPTQRVVEQRNLACRPCSHIGRSYCPQGHFRCMLDLPPQRVVDTVTELVGRDQPPASTPSTP